MIHRWRAAALSLSLLFGAAPAAHAQGTPASAPAALPAETATAPTGTPPAAAPAPAPSAAPADAGAPAAPANLPHDLSPRSMFLNADVVVKAVMVGLLLASVATWTVGLGKAVQLLSGRARARAGLRALGRADGLDAVPDRLGRGPVAALLAAARDEAERSGGLPAEGVKERAALSLSRVEARAARAMAAGTGLLATVGSIAPFVGLFGTVWGIMNSFVGISQAHTSNLAVVAPGIAEALLATAVGLVAAIPAVVIFNGFARATAGYRALLADASAEVMRHLSRDLDRGPALRRRAAE